MFLSLKHKKTILLIIVLLTLSTNFGCRLNKKTIQKDLPSVEKNNETINENRESLDKGSPNEGHMISTTVMLKSIEAIENTDSLVLIFTGFDDTPSQFMKDFQIAYYSDYNELRFSNLNSSLPSEKMLVHSGNISDIAGSSFIRSWYATKSNISHSVVYSVLFRTPIKYTVEELTHPGRIVISIKNDEASSHEQFILRSPSFKLSEAWAHMESTTSFLFHLDPSFHMPFRLLKDVDGYFYPIKAFHNKKDAEALKSELIRLSNQLKDNAYYNNYNKAYILKIEDINQF